MIAGLVFFINLYGNALNNQPGFGDLFAYGFKTTAFLTLAVIAFTVIFILAFPEIKAKGFESARKKLSENADLTKPEIEEMITVSKKMFWVSSIGFIILIYAIMGAIGSALGAAITKKNKFNPADQLNT
jgi:hypothetical protein